MTNRTIISIVFNGIDHLVNKYSLRDNIYLLGSDTKIIFVEGASKSTFCTSWCNQIPENYHKDGHSIDGSLEFIQNLVSTYPDIFSLITTNGFWDGKVTMFNAAIKNLTSPCYLWEEDIDEYWTTTQRMHAERLVENTNADSAAFMCNYKLSDTIIVRGEWGESTGHGYRRLWKYQPGMKFISHEPPVLQGCNKTLPPILMPRFNHLSYYYEQDVKFKSIWYSKHENIYTNWKRIISGEIQLPRKVSSLFGRDDIPTDWANSIITYA